MTRLLQDNPAGRQRRKVMAITLLLVTIMLLAALVIWWASLPDEDPGPMVDDVADEVSVLPE